MRAATASTATEKIARAEEAFSAGEVRTAERLLHEVLADGRTSIEQAAEAKSDLAVVLLALERPAEAERHLLDALAAAAGFAPALENMAVLCRSRGDLVQATHWARRLTEAAPASAEAWSLLITLLQERRRHEEAEDARAQALARGVAPVDPSRSGTGGQMGIAPVAHVPERVLVVVDHFFPSLGGSERLAEAAAVALRGEGFTVGVATRASDARDGRVHRGLPIHEIARHPGEELATVVAEHDYDAVIVFADPASWPLPAALSLPAPRPRIVAIPCINGDGYALLTQDASRLAAYREAIGHADLIGVSSRAGADVRLADELGLPWVYLPNASEEPATGIAPTCTARDGVLLMVANLWPEKNHLGLLAELAGAPGRWRLELIGEPAPARPDIAADVRRHADADPRIAWRGRAEPGGVARAMEAADVLLLPSLAEATPIVLLEAMSRRLPWIATPACGSAHDHAGGLIVPISHFLEAIDFLLTEPEARAALGRAGREHWESSYSWKVIGRRYADILRGREPIGIDPPEAAIRTTEAVRGHFFDSRPSR